MVLKMVIYVTSALTNQTLDLSNVATHVNVKKVSLSFVMHVSHQTEQLEMMILQNVVLEHTLIKILKLVKLVHQDVLAAQIATNVEYVDQNSYSTHPHKNVLNFVEMEKDL